VAALHAIWDSWRTGERLRFEGEHYQHTLMTPFFSPGENPFGPPPVWIAAVGSGMTETAGAVADGLLAHTFTTARYLREVTLPALAAGAASADRPLDGALPAGFGLSVPAFIAVGEGDPELDAAIEATRRQIAFYGSTPEYLPVMRLHGWESVHERLHAASRRGEWAEMARAIDDDMLAAFAAVGSPAEVAATLRDRFTGVATRLSFSASYPIRPELSAALLTALRS
jgi:probable F420-dependent oxidoreductase